MQKDMIRNQNEMWAGRRRNRYVPVTGRIVAVQKRAFEGRGYGGCSRMITVESGDGEITNFWVTPETYVVDFTTLQEGMNVTVFYDSDLPAPLIYPPQFLAAVAALSEEGRMIAVSYFDHSLLAEDKSLQLNFSPETEVLTDNNQTFLGNPGGHVLVVLYSRTTRSIPPQTSPERIIVLCGQ